MSIVKRNEKKENDHSAAPRECIQSIVSCNSLVFNVGQRGAQIHFLAEGTQGFVFRIQGLRS